MESYPGMERTDVSNVQANTCLETTPAARSYANRFLPGRWYPGTLFVRTKKISCDRPPSLDRCSVSSGPNGQPRSSLAHSRPHHHRNSRPPRRKRGRTSPMHVFPGPVPLVDHQKHHGRFFHRHHHHGGRRVWHQLPPPRRRRRLLSQTRSFTSRRLPSLGLCPNLVTIAPKLVAGASPT